MAENFTPGETIALTATTTSAEAAFTLPQSASYPDCMVTNAGSQLAFVGFGNAPAVSAGLPGAGVTNATPVMPGETMMLRKGAGISACAAVTITGSSVLYFTAGQGN